MPNAPIRLLGGGPNDNGALAFVNAVLYEDAEGNLVVEDGSGETSTVGGGSSGGGSSDGGSSAYFVVTDYNGTTLEDKILAAQQDIDTNYNGQGTIYVPPKPDGTPWTWAGDVTFNFAGKQFGLDLHVGWNVKIEYTGSGWPLTIKGSDSSGINIASKSAIRGGIWSMTGSATGWLRLEDAFKTIVAPNRVLYQGAYGVELRNQDKWTEHTMFIGGEYRVNEGIRMIPASAPDVGTPTTGGGGTNSFHDTFIDGAQISASSLCLRLAGACQYVDITATLQTGTAGASLVLLDAERMDGTTFHSLKFEAPASPGDVAAVKYGPSFPNARLGYGVTDAVRGGTNNPLPHYKVHGREHQFGFLGGDQKVTIDENGNVNVDGNFIGDHLDLNHFNANVSVPNYLYVVANGSAYVKVSPSGTDFIRWMPQDATAVSSPTRGQECYHDGSGTLTEGKVVYDGSRWYNPLDGSLG